MKTLKISLFAVAGAFMFSFSANAQQVAPKKDIKPTATIAPAKGPAVVPAKTTEVKDQKPTGLTFVEDVHNFGDIEKGKPVTHEFSFKNTSKQTILITNVKASCGCTTPTWTKTPIKPGETGNVTATYNAANPGAFTKTITVTANDTEQNKILTIKGKVEAPAEAPVAAPATPVQQQ